MPDNETPETLALQARLDAAQAALDVDANDPDNVCAALTETIAVVREALYGVGGLLNQTGDMQTRIGNAVDAMTAEPE